MTPEHDFKAALESFNGIETSHDAVNFKNWYGPAIRAALQLAINPWNDRMEDAPRDGTRVLLNDMTYGPQIGDWSSVYGAWCRCDDPHRSTIVATHWMPLPPKPAHEER